MTMETRAVTNGYGELDRMLDQGARRVGSSPRPIGGGSSFLTRQDDNLGENAASNS